MTLIGNSGFEYITTNVTTNRRQKKLQCTIRDVKTKEVIKSFVGEAGFKSRSRRNDSSGNRPSYKFLGYDKYYYYLQISGGSSVQWGQIQSDGAVLRPNRSILTVISFFPNYEKIETNVPVSAPIIIKEPPYVPKLITLPKTPLPIKTAVPTIPVFNTSIQSTPTVKTIEKKEISWIKETIKKIIDWIKMILKR